MNWIAVLVLTLALDLFSSRSALSNFQFPGLRIHDVSLLYAHQEKEEVNMQPRFPLRMASEDTREYRVEGSLTRERITLSSNTKSAKTLTR